MGHIEWHYIWHFFERDIKNKKEREEQWKTGRKHQNTIPTTHTHTQTCKKKKNNKTLFTHHSLISTTLPRATLNLNGETLEWSYISKSYKKITCFENVFPVFEKICILSIFSKCWFESGFLLLIKRSFNIFGLICLSHGWRVWLCVRKRHRYRQIDTNRDRERENLLIHVNYDIHL